MGTIKIKQGDNWVKLPNYGVQEGLAEAPTDGKLYGRKDSEWSEIVATSSESDIYELPMTIFGLTSSSTSEEISAVIGGDEGFDALWQAVYEKKKITTIRMSQGDDTSMMGYDFISFTRMFQSMDTTSTSTTAPAKGKAIGFLVMIPDGSGAIMLMMIERSELSSPYTYSFVNELMELGGGGELTIDPSDGYKVIQRASGSVSTPSLFTVLTNNNYRKTYSSTSEPSSSTGSNGDIWIQYSE